MLLIIQGASNDIQFLVDFLTDFICEIYQQWQIIFFISECGKKFVYINKHKNKFTQFWLPSYIDELIN